jgi:hypothetical protein
VVGTSHSGVVRTKRGEIYAAETEEEAQALFQGARDALPQ